MAFEEQSAYFIFGAMLLQKFVLMTYFLYLNLQ